MFDTYVSTGHTAAVLYNPTVLTLKDNSIVRLD